MKFMNKQVCPICGTTPEEYYNSNEEETLIDLWCPNCGSTAQWTVIFPTNKSEWKICKMSLEVLEKNENN